MFLCLQSTNKEEREKKIREKNANNTIKKEAQKRTKEQQKNE
jgi:hypothetical protein